MVYDYRKDGTVHVYTEKWYHRIRSAVCMALHHLGLWD